MPPDEVTEVGERHVIADLTAKGFTCRRNRESTHAEMIEVFRGTELICLAKAKTAVEPAVLEGLSVEESGRMKSMAELIGGGAWLVQVKVNDAGQLIEPIIYTQLL